MDYSLSLDLIHHSMNNCHFCSCRDQVEPDAVPIAIHSMVFLLLILLLWSTLHFFLMWNQKWHCFFLNAIPNLCVYSIHFSAAKIYTLTLLTLNLIFHISNRSSSQPPSIGPPAFLLPSQLFRNLVLPVEVSCIPSL